MPPGTIEGMGVARSDEQPRTGQPGEQPRASLLGHSRYDTAGPPPRDLIIQAWREVSTAWTAAGPDDWPDADFLRGTLAALEWALGAKPHTAPLSGTPTSATPTVEQFHDEALYAYGKMHGYVATTEEFRFITGVENTAMWLATGRGIHLR